METLMRLWYHVSLHVVVGGAVVSVHVIRSSCQNSVRIAAKIVQSIKHMDASVSIDNKIALFFLFFV